jgi:hypothetical protein
MGRGVVADALRRAGESVTLLTDHFEPGTPDVVWLPFVGAKGWIVVTKDTRIRYHEAEKRALLDNDVRAIVMSSGNASGPAMADALVAALPRIRALLTRQHGAFVATLSRTGTSMTLRLIS